MGRGATRDVEGYGGGREREREREEDSLHIPESRYGSRNLFQQSSNLGARQERRSCQKKFPPRQRPNAPPHPHPRRSASISSAGEAEARNGLSAPRDAHTYSVAGKVPPLSEALSSNPLRSATSTGSQEQLLLASLTRAFFRELPRDFVRLGHFQTFFEYLSAYFRPSAAALYLSIIHRVIRAPPLPPPHPQNQSAPLPTLAVSFWLFVNFTRE
jgi:hypothetical protein